MEEATFDVVMEHVCEMCHWPFVCEEGELEDKCENCPAECAIRAAMESAWIGVLGGGRLT